MFRSPSTSGPEGPESVLGYQFSLGYDPTVVGGATFEEARTSELFSVVRQNLYADPGVVGLGVVFDMFTPSPELNLTPDQDGIVANLKFCVLDDAQPGTYAFDFIPVARRVNGPAEFKIVYSTKTGVETVSATPDDLINGSVTVAGDPLVGEACEADVHEPAPPGPIPGPPPNLDLKTTFKLPTIDAAFPGDLISVPFVVNSNGGAVGFSFSMDFDETVLEAESWAQTFERPDGEDWDLKIVRLHNENDTPGSGGIDEGYVAGAVIFRLIGLPALFLPPDEDVEVLSIDFRVKNEAPAGITDIEFIDGGFTHPDAQPVPNIVTQFGTSVHPDAEISMILIDGSFQVIAEVTFFTRGDTNGDENIDISDAQLTLEYLFRGGRRPHCFDAADANDDGRINISDPAYTLKYLFRDGDPLPDPTEGPGLDPTPDGITCLTR